MKALPSKVTLSLEQRVWGAEGYVDLPCWLVTSVRKIFFGIGKRLTSCLDALVFCILGRHAWQRGTPGKGASKV